MSGARRWGRWGRRGGGGGALATAAELPPGRLCHAHRIRSKCLGCRSRIIRIIFGLARVVPSVEDRVHLACSSGSLGYRYHRLLPRRSLLCAGMLPRS